MNADKLILQVSKYLEAQVAAAEEAALGKRFGPEERIAFRRGFFRGMEADVNSMSIEDWHRASKEPA